MHYSVLRPALRTQSRDPTVSSPPDSDNLTKSHNIKLLLKLTTFVYKFLHLFCIYFSRVLHGLKTFSYSFYRQTNVRDSKDSSSSTPSVVAPGLGFVRSYLNVSLWTMGRRASSNSPYTLPQQ